MSIKKEQYTDWINIYGLVMQKITPQIARILEYISLNNTTNISKIARDVNLPITTVYGILRRLITRHIITIHNLINISALGLTQYAVIFHCDKIENVKKILMSNHTYWIYYAKGYCDSLCAYVRYIVPIDHNKDFIEFLNTAKEIGLINDYEVYATTNTYNVPLNFKDFDFKKKVWVFNWEQILHNFYSAESNDNERLNVRSLSRIKLDNIDSKILLGREINAFISLSSIQKTLNNISLQNIYYHYVNHIVKRNLINSIKIAFLPYPYTVNEKIVSDAMIFFITFKNTTWMNKFVNALKYKIFISSIARVLGENTLLLSVYLPHIETAEFLNLLDKLIEDNIIIKYRFFIIDIRTARNETIPYSAYNTHEGTWQWDQSKYLSNLQEHTILQNDENSILTLR